MARQCNSLKFRTMDRHIPSKNTKFFKTRLGISFSDHEKKHNLRHSAFLLPLKVFLKKKLVTFFSLSALFKPPAESVIDLQRLAESVIDLQRLAEGVIDFQRLAKSVIQS